MSVKKGDIYYVVNLEDYPITYDSDGSNVTHFFYFESNNYDTENFDKWKNISKDELDKRSTEEADRARYLYDIINTNLGNNPHIGYGRYDNGQDYFEKISKPFEYKLNNIPNYEDTNNDNFKFNIKISNDDKTHNAIKTNENNSGNELINKDDKYFVKLNSKVFIIHNNNENYNFKKYLKETIIPYVLQVIPSTTILKLENFN